MKSRCSRRRLLVAAVFAVAVVALFLQAAGLPHAHAGTEPAFFNHDHDLTLLATLGLGATLPDAAVTITSAVVIGAVGLGLQTTPPAPPRRRPSSRAPPAR